MLEPATMQMTMYPEGRPRRIRYAIGLFTGPGAIGRALDDLATSGIDRHDVCLVAPTDAFHGAFLNWLRATARADEHRDFDEWVVSGSAASVCPWAGSRLVRKLDDHLAIGGGLVIVKMAGDREERAICRSLLAHAGAGVQTHDVSAARQDGG